MIVRLISENSKDIAFVTSNELLITDVQSALDFMATIYYEYHCDRVIIHKENVCEDFFDLKTRIAGGILQKFVTYQMKIAIIGDFSLYTSKSLKDFIYESNKGTHVFFLEEEQQAVKRFSVI